MDLRSKKKIFFTPSSQYISDPIYNEVSQNVKETEEFSYFKLFEFGKKNINDQLSETFAIKNNDLKILARYLSFSKIKRIRYFNTFAKELRLYKKRMWEVLDKESPDAIITTAETLSTLICLDWAQKRKKAGIIVQPSFIVVQNEVTFSSFL